MYIVADLMDHLPIKVHPSTSRNECCNLILSKNISFLLVVEGNKLSGIITKSDFLSKPSALNALQLSSRKIAVTSPDVIVYEALDKMQQFGFKQLPVISNMELKGIITRDSIYSSLIKVNSTPDKIEDQELELPQSSAVYEGICDVCGSLTIIRPVKDKMICFECLENKN